MLMAHQLLLSPYPFADVTIHQNKNPGGFQLFDLLIVRELPTTR